MKNGLKKNGGAGGMSPGWNDQICGASLEWEVAYKEVRGGVAAAHE